MTNLIKAIIFDFDGVILDDASVKEDAFKQIFPKEFNKIIIPVLEKYTKQSRKIIIQKCIEKIETKHKLSFDYEYYLNKYGALTQETILNSPEIRGATKALNVLSEKYKLFVLTATPDKQIAEIIKKRGFDQFTEIIGSDKGSKPELARELLKKYDLNSNEVIYIGDGSNDLACARELNFEFIGIINETNDFKNRLDIRYKDIDLQNIVSIVNKINCK